MTQWHSSATADCRIQATAASSSSVVIPHIRSTHNSVSEMRSFRSAVAAALILLEVLLFSCPGEWFTYLSV